MKHQLAYWQLFKQMYVVLHIRQDPLYFKVRKEFHKNYEWIARSMQNANTLHTRIRSFLWLFWFPELRNEKINQTADDQYK